MNVDLAALAEALALECERRGYPVDRAYLARRLPRILAKQARIERRLKPLGWLLDVVLPWR